MVEEWERGRSGSCPLRRSGGERGFSCTSDMLARLLQPAVRYLLDPMTSAALLFASELLQPNLVYFRARSLALLEAKHTRVAVLAVSQSSRSFIEQGCSPRISDQLR
jgi:hypothetical protein